MVPGPAAGTTRRLRRRHGAHVDSRVWSSQSHFFQQHGGNDRRARSQLLRVRSRHALKFVAVVAGGRHRTSASLHLTRGRRHRPSPPITRIACRAVMQGPGPDDVCHFLHNNGHLGGPRPGEAVADIATAVTADRLGAKEGGSANREPGVGISTRPTALFGFLWLRGGGEEGYYFICLGRWPM